MARIYLDAWGIKGGPHGIARYCRSLVPALVAAAPEHSFVIVRPPPAPGDRLVDAAGVPEAALPLPQTDWATLAFRPFLEPVFRRYGRPDLYHSLFHMLPIGLGRGRHGPRSIVVTLHDLIAIDFLDQAGRGALDRAWARRFDPRVIPYALARADHVICVSEVTRQRAREWVSPARSTTVHSGVDLRLREFARRAPPAGAGRPPPYLAALGVDRPYKNVGCLVRALPAIRRTRPDVGLVLIGGDGGAGEEIDRLGLRDAVTITPAVVEGDLAAIVAAAAVFVMPSRAEGFGLPMLEAMAVGTPVAASCLPVLHEVAADAALWFDPESPGQLAAVVLRLLGEPALRSAMVALGRARAAAMTWEQTAAATLAVYARVLAGG